MITGMRQCLLAGKDGVKSREPCYLGPKIYGDVADTTGGPTSKALNSKEFRSVTILAEMQGCRESRGGESRGNCIGWKKSCSYLLKQNYFHR